MKKVRTFMQAFGQPKEISKMLWMLYEAALNSKMADSWDKNKRADVYFFIKTLTQFFKGFAVVYKLTEETMARKQENQN